jgi:hypothetical protein
MLNRDKDWEEKYKVGKRTNVRMLGREVASEQEVSKASLKWVTSE